MSTRLDAALVQRGLAPSRTQAQLLVRDGRVRVDGSPVRRPATPVGDGQEGVLDDADEGAASAWVSEGWVGRGALKLRHALQEWAPQGLTVTGRRCLDVGASTGGLTQALLAAGAASVLALDVGHDQLHHDLRDDPRVRDLSPSSRPSPLTTMVLPAPVSPVMTLSPGLRSSSASSMTPRPWMRMRRRVIRARPPPVRAPVPASR